MNSHSSTTTEQDPIGCDRATIESLTDVQLNAVVGLLLHGAIANAPLGTETLGAYAQTLPEIHDREAATRLRSAAALVHAAQRTAKDLPVLTELAA